MEKLDVDAMFPSQDDYDQARLEFIAEYERYVPGGFLSMGHYEKRPAEAEAKWNRTYPKGFISWREKAYHATYSDLKTIEVKVNEIIDFLRPKP